MATLEVQNKYLNDPIFHRMVWYLEKGLVEKTYLPEELNQAVQLAIELYQNRTIIDE